MIDDCAAWRLESPRCDGGWFRSNGKKKERKRCCFGLEVGRFVRYRNSRSFVRASRMSRSKARSSVQDKSLNILRLAG